MLSLLVLLAAADAPRSPTDLMANAAKLTGIQRCERKIDDTDITVCGLRNADHLRVPFVVHDPGDRRYRSVAAERDELLHRTTKIQEMSPFLVESGMAGVTASTNGSGKSVTGYRKLAP